MAWAPQSGGADAEGLVRPRAPEVLERVLGLGLGRGRVFAAAELSENSPGFQLSLASPRAEPTG